MANRWGENINSERLFSGGSKSLQMLTAAMKLKDYCSLEEKLWQPSCFSLLKSRDITANKGLSSQSYGFSSSHVWMWDLEYKEGWAPKNRCFWTAVLKKTLESPLESKEIQRVHPKEDQSWVFIGRTYAEAETPTLWLPYRKNWFIGKDPDAGKNWRWEEEMTEHEMVGWHHELNENEWVGSGSWWWTGKPGMLQSMGSQKPGHDWETELIMLYVLEMVDLNRTLWSHFVWTEKKMFQ